MTQITDFKTIKTKYSNGDEFELQTKYPFGDKTIHQRISQIEILLNQTTSQPEIEYTFEYFDEYCGWRPYGSHALFVDSTLEDKIIFNDCFGDSRILLKTSGPTEIKVEPKFNIGDVCLTTVNRQTPYDISTFYEDCFCGDVFKIEDIKIRIYGKNVRYYYMYRNKNIIYDGFRRTVGFERRRTTSLPEDKNWEPQGRLYKISDIDLDELVRLRAQTYIDAQYRDKELYMMYGPDNKPRIDEYGRYVEPFSGLFAALGEEERAVKIWNECLKEYKTKQTKRHIKKSKTKVDNILENLSEKELAELRKKLNV